MTTMVLTGPALTGMAPTVTVVIPSRDRPWQLREALQSVLDQSLDQVEVIVVDDGSMAQYAAAYRDIEEQAPSHVRFIHLAHTPRGHGSSFARNVGAAAATGTHLTFLDDDDALTDMSYLERAMAALAASGPVDLHLSDQLAFAAGVKVERKIWIEDLRDRLGDAPPADATGAHVVTPAMLLACVGFAHLNTTVVSRTLFDAIGGFDECQRYEADRDFYLRAIDHAGIIKYSPFYVARHNVPDPRLAVNVSTIVSRTNRAVFQLRLLNKAVLFSTRPEIGAYARRHHAYVLRRIAEALYAERNFPIARYYAWSALASRFTLKWLGFCVLATTRSLLPMSLLPMGPARAQPASAPYMAMSDVLRTAPAVPS